MKDGVNNRKCINYVISRSVQVDHYIRQNYVHVMLSTCLLSCITVNVEGRLMI